MIPDRDRPIAVTFTDVDLLVTLANQRQINIPLANFPALAHATPDQRAIVQLSLVGLYWSELNLDISLLGLLSETSSAPCRHKPCYCEG